MSYQSLHSLSPLTTTVVVDAEVEVEIEIVDEEDTVPWFVIGLLLCLLVYCLFSCCSPCYRAPGSEYQHGEARHDKYTDEERQQQIHNDSSIQTMIVIEKELQTGYYKLGPIDNTTTTMTTTTKMSTQNDEVSSVVHTKETNIGMNIVSIESKPSTDTADTVPFDSDSDSEPDHNNDCNKNDDDDDDNDDYDGVCHICLDGFNIGDTVMFHNNRKMDMMNRNTKDCSGGGDSNSDSNSNAPQLLFSSSSCGHFFHQECIMQWLVERRENGCPSCRSVFIDSDDDSRDNNIINNEDDDIENNIDFGNNNNNNNNENDSDSDSIAIEVDVEKGILHDNNNNDSTNSHHHSNLNDTIIMDEEITNNDNNSDDDDNTENDNNGDNNNNNDTPFTYYIAHGRILEAVR